MQQEQIQRQQQDPLTQIQQRELAIQEAELQHKIEMDNLKLQLEAAKLQSDNKIAGAKVGVQIASELDARQRKDKVVGTKLGLEIAKELNKGGT